MNSSLAMQRLTDHLRRIESEIRDIRQELKSLPYQQKPSALAGATIPYRFSDKLLLKEQMRQLFLTFSIESKSIGVEALQQQMREAGLTTSEFSQVIILAREE